LQPKAYVQKITDPKLTKLYDKPNSTGFATKDTINKACQSVEYGVLTSVFAKPTPYISTLITAS
jgi:hypothetical protein